MKISICLLLSLTTTLLHADLTVDDVGGFLVNYPATVTHDTKKADTVMGKVSEHTTTCTNEAGYYGIIYCDLESDKSVTNLPGFYQEMLDLTVKSEKLQLLSKTDFK